MICPHCGKNIVPRFWHFTQHEQSIFYELLKEPNDMFLFFDADPIMADQNNPMESTRKALLKELNDTSCHCCYTEKDLVKDD